MNNLFFDSFLRDAGVSDSYPSSPKHPLCPVVHMHVFWISTAECLSEELVVIHQQHFKKSMSIKNIIKLLDFLEYHRTYFNLLLRAVETYFLCRKSFLIMAFLYFACVYA